MNVIIYDKDYFAGNSKLLQGPMEINMEEGEMENWNDKIKSMKVQLKVTAASDPYLVGRWNLVAEGNGKIG